METVFRLGSVALLVLFVSITIRSPVPYSPLHWAMDDSRASLLLDGLDDLGVEHEAESIEALEALVGSGKPVSAATSASSFSALSNGQQPFSGWSRVCIYPSSSGFDRIVGGVPFPHPTDPHRLSSRPFGRGEAPTLCWLGWLVSNTRPAAPALNPHQHLTRTIAAAHPRRSTCRLWLVE